MTTRAGLTEKISGSFEANLLAELNVLKHTRCDDRQIREFLFKPSPRIWVPSRR